ncbi:MAG TPA: DUF1931 family protein [Mycobacterium sp.]|nr:DUF1931 family protein [Mycobacterium sp.]
MTHPSGVPVFARFFRSVASIDIDRNDVRRFRDFVDRMIRRHRHYRARLGQMERAGRHRTAGLTDHQGRPGAHARV